MTTANIERARAERDRWIRAFNRLSAAITHHEETCAGVTSDADDALHRAHAKVLRDLTQKESTE